MKEVDIDKKEFVINGDTIVCKGESLEYSISTNETALWSNGIIGSKASFSFNNDTIIKAIVTNQFGCEYEQVKSITVADLPEKPVIERTGNELFVNNVSGHFEWYRNGLLYSVGLNYIFTNLEGEYTVKVSDNNGCESISDGFYFIITSTQDLSSNVGWTVYPNPALNIIRINPNINFLDSYLIKLSSTDGRRWPVYINSDYLEVSHLPNGYYLLSISDQFNAITLPFIKMN
jgi:hypothetical protein